jgi:P-aminobenzoate N-oxygenase AurF
MTVTDPNASELAQELTDPGVDGRRGQDDATFVRLVERLSRQSVDKHYDAYADIPWDDPAFVIDPDDPRWELDKWDGLGATLWYQNQPPGIRSRIGLYRIASAMKVGLQFENILKRGLLEHAFTLDNRDPTFRYAYHEVIEEAQHGMMFQEFVNRTPYDMGGLAWIERFASDRIVKLGRWFPQLFFMFVLGGEDPIDHVQRQALSHAENLHPLTETIMRHHVTEEARHLSFARHYLKREVPQLSWMRRQALAVTTPLILGTMAQLMMQAPGDLIATFAIPHEVVREAYRDSPDHARATVESLRKVRRLSREIGIINPVSKRLWQTLGIWDDDEKS